MVPLVRMIGRVRFVAVSGTKLFGDAIHRGRRLEDRFVEMIVHAVGILARIQVMLADDLGRAEADNPEEELGRQVGLAHEEGDTVPPLGGEFSGQLADHLAAHAVASQLRVGGEVEDVDLVAVQLVDHEPDDSITELGNHADAVPLTEDPEELLLAPGILETRMLDGQDLGHVAANHPANMYSSLGQRGRNRAHRASFHGTFRYDRLHARPGAFRPCNHWSPSSAMSGTAWEWRRLDRGASNLCKRSTPPRISKARRILAEGHWPAKVASTAISRDRPICPGDDDEPGSRTSVGDDRSGTPFPSFPMYRHRPDES